MMSKERRTLLITTFICLCSLLVYISFTAVYPEPKTVQAKFIFKYALCWWYRYKCSFKYCIEF